MSDAGYDLAYWPCDMFPADAIAPHIFTDFQVEVLKTTERWVAEGIEDNGGYLDKDAEGLGFLLMKQNGIKFPRELGSDGLPTYLTSWMDFA